MSRDPILRIYMLTFIGIGLSAYMFRTVLGRFFVRRYSYFVSNVKNLTQSIVEVELTPESGAAFTYLPGQFVFISFAQAGLTETHPFSLSSASHDRLALTAKVLGDFTDKLTNVAVGSGAKIEGPFGRFSFFIHHNRKQIWVAGGIGITPFVSMSRILTPGFSVDLYYTISDKNEAVYFEELTHIAGQNPGFRVFLWPTHEKGRLTAQTVKETSTFSDQDIFICGPPQMMYSLKQQFRKLGISTRHIHTEEFQML
jgi:predicted ferric reductase